MPIDPTRSITLRRQFTNAGVRRYTAISKQLGPLIDRLNDPGFAVFGDTGSSFESAFRDLLERRFNEPAFDQFVITAYTKGIQRAHAETRQAQFVKITPDSRREFTRRVIEAPERRRQFSGMFSRFRTEMNGINSELTRQVLRRVADGISRGETKSWFKRNIAERIAKIGKTRFLLLAHDMVIRAHAEGQLDSFQTLGIPRVQAEVELLTAGDDRVCSQCRALSTRAFTTEEARNRIPVHARCRCAWRLLDIDRTQLRRSSRGNGNLLERNQ